MRRVFFTVPSKHGKTLSFFVDVVNVRIVVPARHFTFFIFYLFEILPTLFGSRQERVHNFCYTFIRKIHNGKIFLTITEVYIYLSEKNRTDEQISKLPLGCQSSAIKYYTMI